jgi:hypothetical protein
MSPLEDIDPFPTYILPFPVFLPPCSIFRPRYISVALPDDLDPSAELGLCCNPNTLGGAGNASPALNLIPLAEEPDEIPEEVTGLGAD